MYQKIETLIRWLIAAVVIGITAALTWDETNISQEWQAVFVMVIAYYFKDRPQTERMQASRLRDTPLPNEAALELGTQFLLALALLILTVILFMRMPLRNEIAGAWIGGVTVAISFYFKDAAAVDRTVAVQHDIQRALLAIGVAVSTAVIYSWRHAPALKSEGTIDALPVQWVALAFIVITFYFKERSSGDQTTTVTATAAA